MGRSSDTKERLILTALQLVQARSYTSVSVDNLCNQAQVNKGSFYYFFPSKRELLLEALEAHWDNTRREVFEPAFSVKMPALTRISFIFERSYLRHKALQIETGQMLGCPFGNVAIELSTQDEVIRNKIQEIFGRICTYFEKALNEALASGEVADLDVSLTAQALLAYFEGIILVAKTQNDAEVIKRLSKGVLRLVG